MADRLNLSKGWLSKMLKVASLPDTVVAAFASPADVQLKPAYPLAQLLDNRELAPAILREAKILARLQEERRKAGDPAIAANDVVARLMAAGTVKADGPPREIVLEGRGGRPAITVRSINRQGVTLRFHAGSGMHLDALLELARDALEQLEDEGRSILL